MSPARPTGAQPPRYPREKEVDVALRDGSTARIRPVAASDRDAVVEFLRGLSPASIGMRFFGQPNIEQAARWSTEVDYRDRYALVAVSGPGQEVVAHAEYVRDRDESAEVAFAVADAWQGRGIATIMLAQLASAAEEHGIGTFLAEVLPQNHQMIQVFADSGFEPRLQAREGVIEVELPTSRTERNRELFQQRERVAATAAVERFLRPSAVAVVGASGRRATIGAEVVRNLVDFGFAGPVYPVNRAGGVVHGRSSARSLAELPTPADLVVVAVPAANVVQVAREAAQAGARALMVISAGFAEVGEDGAALQRELLDACREGGLRLVGPNCLGVINTAPDVRLDATFAAREPPPGPIGFISQSGGVGIAIIETAGRLGLGLSAFASIGNRADVSGNDLLEYFEQDPRTGVILMYLESFGNPRRFARIARRVAQSKPVVAVKSGRSRAGARATTSHTGALLASSDSTVEALFAQAGVIRTDTMHDLFGVGALLARQPVPAGRRVAIVTNVGGPGILCADACEGAGLLVAELPEAVRAQLRSILPAHASVGNPVDMTAAAPADACRKVIEVLVAERACDAVIAIFVLPLLTRTEDVARELRLAARGAGPVTLAAVFMTGEDPPAVQEGIDGVPGFDFPEDAARALAHAADYGAWRRRPRGRFDRPPGLRTAQATAVIAAALADGGGWLGAGEIAALLSCYGLPLIQTRTTRDADGAVAAASELGYPVAVKAVASGLVHKTEAGGVMLGLADADGVREAVHAIAAAVRASGHELDGLLVQPMAAPGIELLMGVVHDPIFGPVIACGAGGTSAEVLADAAVRITPLSDLDAREMLASLRVSALLRGYRGAPAADMAALEDALLRLSALVEAHPSVAELDFNPVIASPGGAQILDARVRVEAVAPRRPPGALARPGAAGPRTG